MKPMRVLACVGMSAASLVLAASMGWSQGPPPGGAGRGAGASAPIFTPVELERWFDSYVLLQAQDTLKLTDAQFARVLPALKALQGARRRHLQSRRQILNSVGGLLKANPVDEAALRERLKGLRDLDAKSRDEIQRAYDALDEALDATQQARFRLFEEQVERRKIDLLMKARQRAGEQSGANRSR
jgi:Spy/CpxP family protein refolding chaperone